MLIKMHLITLFRVTNPYQRCLQAKVKYRNEPKQVMPKNEDSSRSQGIKPLIDKIKSIATGDCINWIL